MALLVLLAFALFLSGALLCRLRTVSYLLAAGGSLVSAVLAFAAVAGERLRLLLPLTGGLEVGLRLDHLASVYLSIAALSWLAITLAARRPGRALRSSVALALNLSLGGMLLVFTAADVVLFLAGWEVMTVFAFLLLTGGGAKASRAFAFLAFGELSQALLVAAFALLFARTHSLSIAAGSLVPPAFLVLASLGTVVKMDVLPFHTWMRGVYERLPGFVAAIMSVGVTLTGVYGFERVLAISGYSEWWMLVLALLGALSAFWGAVQSAVARTIRGVPAYSTVEYNGMILAVAALGAVAGNGHGAGLAYMAAFAGAATIMLALAHAFAKSLFFLGIGEGIDGSGAVYLEGLRTSLPRSRSVPAVGLIVAALSFAAFPPLAGYLGEWMILETTFQSYKLATFADRLVASLSGVFIALAIGLAAFAMVRFVGYAMLGRRGRPREPNEAEQGSATTRGVLVALAVLVFALAVGSPWVLTFFGFGRLLGSLLDVPHPLLLVSGIPTFGVLSPTMFAVVMAVLTALPLLAWALRRRRSRVVAVWHGGAPLAERERFSSAAYRQILSHVMRGLLGRKETTEGASRTFTTRDFVEDLYRLFHSALSLLADLFARLYMNGRIGWYVTYILMTFVIVILLAAL